MNEHAMKADVEKKTMRVCEIESINLSFVKSSELCSLFKTTCLCGESYFSWKTLYFSCLRAIAWTLCAFRFEYCVCFFIYANADITSSRCERGGEVENRTKKMLKLSNVV